VRNRIFGAIGVLWGGGILVSAFFREVPQGASEAYARGFNMGLAFGGLLLIIGAYYLFKGIKNKS
jgi:hypothetical protein